MIKRLEIINQPFSGQFKERIYDTQNAWNSQNWTWIKVLEDNGFEWCGQFRGVLLSIGFSNKIKYLYILTSDNLYVLDKLGGDIHKIIPQTNFKNIINTPNDDLIFYDDNNLFLLSEQNQILKIETTISMDFIEFKTWEGNKFIFDCYEIGIWNNVTMELDMENLLINKRNVT